MTNMDKISVFDEIINCGILEEDSVVNFGAGSNNGKFIETLIEYNGSIQKGTFTAVEPDPKKIKTLTKKFLNEDILFLESSLQSYIDSEPQNSDWVVITGVFDDHLYGEHQHDYVDSVIQSSIGIANKGVIFSIKEEMDTDFKYSIIYFFVSLRNTYEKLTLKKFSDGIYIFCIFKQ